MAKQMSKKVILKMFFGYRPGDGLKQFTEELNALTPEEQTELARLAANEMDGIELAES